MKKYGFLTIMLLVWACGYGQDTTAVKTDKFELDLGGALRFNYNNSSWKPNQQTRGGDFGFETFRIEVDARYRGWTFKIDQRLYANEFGGAFLKYGYAQYALNEQSNFKIGLIPAYFGAQQFNSHSWFFQLPFYLGFEDDHDMGLSYSFNNGRHQLDVGYYKNAEEYSFGNSTEVSDSRYSYDFSGRNQEVNQVNVRYNYQFGESAKHRVGGTIQYGGIWNLDTEKMGTQRAFGLHYDLQYGRWTVKAQYLDYDNRPENAVGQPRNQLTMTAYGFPYQTAAQARIYSVGVSYTVPFIWGPITALQFYNDYSYMDKAETSWEDTQMNVLGVLISAEPVYIYVDYAAGRHQPWLGPQWEQALTTGDENNGWESRFNINLGLYF